MLAGRRVAPGTRTRIDIPLPNLFTQTRVYLPVHVLHGRHVGPRLFIVAAIHGDEINGIEIIRQLLDIRALQGLRGTLLAVPVVNVYGFVRHSRYLPDRRDLNRCFPGSEVGSLAARLAATLLQEIVRDSDVGIDLHTGAAHRENLPQIRAALDDFGTLELARAFGAPVIVNAEIRDGSLRGEAAALGVPVLVYEAGEALRFSEIGIRAGLRGVLAVMRELGMIRGSTSGPRRPPSAPSLVARATTWARAHESGVLRSFKALGATVEQNDCLATIGDPFGDSETPVLAPVSGIVIGRTNLPLVTEGEALFHIARYGRHEAPDPDEPTQGLFGFDETIDPPE